MKTLTDDDPVQLISGAPSGLQDVFDLDRFSGRRGLPMGPRVNQPWALLAGGVPVAGGVPAGQVYGVLSTEVDRNS